MTQSNYSTSFHTVGTKTVSSKVAPKRNTFFNSQTVQKHLTDMTPKDMLVRVNQTKEGWRFCACKATLSVVTFEKEQPPSTAELPPNPEPSPIMPKFDVSTKEELDMKTDV